MESIKPNPNQPQQGNSPTTSAAFDKEKIKGFYKESLPRIVKTFFSEPI